MDVPFVDEEERCKVNGSLHLKQCLFINPTEDSDLFLCYLHVD